MKTRELRHILLPLAIITLILGVCHYFIYLSLTRSIPEGSLWARELASLLILGWLSIPLVFVVSFTKLKKTLFWFPWIGYTWMGFFHLLFFSSLVEFALNFIYPHEYSDWNFFFALAVGLYALYKGMRTPQVVHHEIKGPASMRGMTLAQVSDLHVGLLHLNAKWLAKVVALVNEQNVDIFTITGDLVEGPFAEVSPQLEILKTAKARLEKFYITGNHEYIHGSGPWETRLQQLGYTVLHNQNKVVTFHEAAILFAGVPDRMVRRFDSSLQSLPDVALKSGEKTDYKILLAHEPASRWDMKTESCDLLLSGHTHGGQIFPFGFLVRLAQPVVAGFKQMGSVLVFAHQGTGLWGPPMRWFSRSEIVIFKWV